MVAAVLQYRSRSSGSGSRDQLVPPAESHQHVNPQRHERFQPVGHRRRLDRQQFRRKLTGEFVRGIERGARIAFEHRGIHHEVQIVRAIQRVEVQRSLAVDETPINLYRRQIRHHRVAVVAAQHVDVAWHVQQMARVGHQIAQQVRGGQRILRAGRHLHGVQVEMQDHRGVRVPRGWPARCRGSAWPPPPASRAQARRFWCPTTPMRSC